MVNVLLLVALTTCATSDSPQYSDRDIQRRMHTQRISVEFRDATLDVVASHLQKSMGIRFVISPAVWPRDMKINLKVAGLKVITILKLLFISRNLTVHVRAGTVEIIPHHCGHPVYTTVAYDVTNSVHEAKDLLKAIRENTGGDSWTTDSSVWLKRIGRAIFVRQTRLVQQEIRLLFARRGLFR